MEENLDIVAIGECLIELSANTSLTSADCLYKYYGGDALATAISALRLGSKVGFITKVGNDAFKEFLMDSWQAEGLDISQIKLANEPNGFYFITRPVDADKEIAYYRKKLLLQSFPLMIFQKNIFQAQKFYILPVQLCLCLFLPRKLF